MTYTREFLISAFLSRYVSIETDAFMRLVDMTELFYSSVSREQFRSYCSLDAAAIKDYKNKLAAGTVF
jgi:hypothetical protein